MAARHFLSLDDAGPDLLIDLVQHSIRWATDDGNHQPLRGKYVGVFFLKPSTRTRTSFTIGAQRLGATTISYGSEDLQLATGETFEDTGRILAGYLDVLVVRTNGPVAEMRSLAQQNEMAVINAMSAEEHPTQAIADMSILYETFGRLEGLHILYIGEGNNTVSALTSACSQISGMRLTLMTPEGFGLPDDYLKPAQEAARRIGSEIAQHCDLALLPTQVDAVYATRWNTMGVPKLDRDWRQKFEAFRVSSEIMKKVSKTTGTTIFLHDLPAVRGDDVTNEVLDGPQSRAWRQARYKMWSAMAILEWCLAGSR